MKKGRIVWFNSQKGFGYALDSDGNSVFVHYSAIESDDSFKVLHKDTPVAFNVEESEDGTVRATKVRPLSPEGNA